MGKYVDTSSGAMLQVPRNVNKQCLLDTPAQKQKDAMDGQTKDRFAGMVHYVTKTRCSCL